METRTKGPEPSRGRGLRAGLVLGASLVVLVLLVLLVGPMLVPTDRLRRSAESAAGDALGREVTIGSLDLRLLPTPTVTMRDVSIAASDAAKTETLAEAELLRGRVSPLPLLRRRVELSRITLERGTLRLERLPDGSFAALDLLDILERDTKARWDVGLDRVSFERVDLEIIDRHVAPGSAVVTRGRDATGSVLLGSIERGIPIEMDMALFEHPTWNVRVRGLLPRAPPPDQADEAVSLQDPSRPIDLQLRFVDVRTEPLRPYLGSTTEFLPPTFSLDLSFTGDLAATVDVEGSLELSPQLILTLSGPVDLSQGEPRASLEFTAGPMDLDHLITLMPSVVEALPRPLDVEGRFRLAGRLSGPPKELRIAAWLQSAGLRLAAGSFLGGSSERAGVVLESEELVASIDAELRGERSPRLNLDIRSTRAILDYRTGDDAPGDPMTLPEILINARLRVEGGRFLLLEFQDLDALLRLHEGRMTLRPWLQAHEGSMRARLDTDLNRAPSSHRLELELIDVDAASLARELLQDPDPPATGILSVEMLVGWRGTDFDALRRTALGEGSVALREGRIATLDLEPDVAEALRQVAETIGVVPPHEFTEPTLREARGTFLIANGAVTTEIMEVRGTSVRILLNGALGMDRALALTGSFAFNPQAADRFGPVGQVLRGPDGWLAVPFSVSGRVEEPEVSIDIATLLRRAAAGLAGTPDSRWEELRRLWREHWSPPGSPAG